MGKHHGIESLVEPCSGIGEVFIFRDRCLAAVSTRPGYKVGQSESQIRMDESKQQVVERMPEDPVKESGSSVLL